MKRDETKARYFPSDKFLAKYFGPDHETDVTLQATNRPLMAHCYVRNELDKCLRRRTMRIMRAIIDKRGVLFNGIHVVKHGMLRPWAVRLLDSRGFIFTKEAEQELAQELIAHYRQHPFHHDDWWEWFATTDSLGATLAPHAKPEGGNRIPISLRDIFDSSA